MSDGNWARKRVIYITLCFGEFVQCISKSFQEYLHANDGSLLWPTIVRACCQNLRLSGISISRTNGYSTTAGALHDADPLFPSCFSSTPLRCLLIYTKRHAKMFCSQNDSPFHARFYPTHPSGEWKQKCRKRPETSLKTNRISQIKPPFQKATSSTHDRGLSPSTA